LAREVHSEGERGEIRRRQPWIISVTCLVGVVSAPSVVKVTWPR